MRVSAWLVGKLGREEECSAQGACVPQSHHGMFLGYEFRNLYANIHACVKCICI